MSETDIKDVVRSRYGEIARSVRTPGSSCCYDGERGSEGISAGYILFGLFSAVGGNCWLRSGRAVGVNRG